MSEEKEYLVSLNALGVSTGEDPFAVSPPKTVTYWADNKGVLDKLLDIENDSLMFSSPALYIFWGPIGVGKTFAANFLATPGIVKIGGRKLKNAKKFDAAVFRVRAPSPNRTGDLTYGVHKAIVQRLITKICEDDALLKHLKASHKDLEVGAVKAAFKDVGSRISNTLNGSNFITDVESSEGFKYIAGERSKIGKLTITNDMVLIVRTLVEILLQKEKRLVILIDEVENLRSASSTERLLFSDYMRGVHDAIDSGVTWILVFTWDSYQGVQEWLQAAVVSRVREVIEFGYVRTAKDAKEYISECWELRSGQKSSEAFDSEVLTMISERLLARFRPKLSFRTINIEMHGIIARCYTAAGEPEKFKIDSGLYQKSLNLSKVT